MERLRKTVGFRKLLKYFHTVQFTVAQNGRLGLKHYLTNYTIYSFELEQPCIYFIKMFDIMFSWHATQSASEVRVSLPDCS